MRLLIATAAQIGGIYKIAAIGGELADTNIKLPALECILDHTGCYRVTLRPYNTAAIKIALVVISGGKAPVIGPGAGYAGKYICWIYDQRVLRIILTGYFKTNLITIYTVTNLYGYTLVTDVLICVRHQLCRGAYRGSDLQLVFLQLQPVNTVILQLNIGGIGAGMHDQIVLQ